MNFIDIIGIDVSKKVIDVCIHSNQFTKQFHNTKTGLKKFINWTIINTTSIEVIIKLADVLNVSIDFLVGKTTLELNKKALKRIEEVSKLNQEEQDKIFMVIDALIRDFNAKKAYS